MRLPFGPFEPDAAGPNTGKSAIANNVLPQITGWGPAPSLVTANGAEALSGAPRGLISLQLFNGTWRVYAATATTIEELSSTYQWSDIDTGRTVTAGDDVSFCHFGSKLINTDTTDGMMAYDVEAGGTNDPISGAPAARCILSCANVLIALDCDGNNRRMQTSDIGRYDVWDSGGADGVTFTDGGALIGGRDLQGDAAIIFQEAAMRLVQFGASAGDALYTVKKVADGRGAVSDRSIVAFDGVAYYLAQDGFWKFSLNGGNQPIGAEKVNRWFATQVATADYALVQASVDPLQKVVWWRLGSELLLGYDWQLDRFFTADPETTYLTRIATAGVTIDELSGTIDEQDFAFNSRELQGSLPIFGALDAAYKFATFSGGAMAATLQTAVVAGPRSLLHRWATPVTDAPNCTLALGVSDDESAGIVRKPASTRASGGRFKTRGRGKNFDFLLAVPANDNWTYANGIDAIDASAGGPK